MYFTLNIIILHIEYQYRAALLLINNNNTEPDQCQIQE